MLSDWAVKSVCDDEDDHHQQQQYKSVSAVSLNVLEWPLTSLKVMLTSSSAFDCSRPPCRCRRISQPCRAIFVYRQPHYMRSSHHRHHHCHNRYRRRWKQNIYDTNTFAGNMQRISLHHYARQHNAIARICYHPSVRLSVRRAYHRKTFERRIMKFSPYGSPIPLVLRGNVSSRNSKGSA